jgi:hypothetical protein
MSGRVQGVFPLSPWPMKFSLRKSGTLVWLQSNKRQHCSAVKNLHATKNCLARTAYLCTVQAQTFWNLASQVIQNARETPSLCLPLLLSCHSWTGSAKPASWRRQIPGRPTRWRFMALLSFCAFSISLQLTHAPPKTLQVARSVEWHSRVLSYSRMGY